MFQTTPRAELGYSVRRFQGEWKREKPRYQSPASVPGLWKLMLALERWS